MTVVASPAPNIFGSPSWAGYVINALNSLENDLGEIGNRSTDPTAYSIFDPGSLIDPSEIIPLSPEQEEFRQMLTTLDRKGYGANYR